MKPALGKAIGDALRKRCPNCRRGRVLARWPNKMLPRCPVCGLSFFRESGSYIGGMMITYALTAIVLIAVYLASLLLPDTQLSVNRILALWIAFGAALSLVFMPYAYSLWLSLDFWLNPWKPEGEVES